MPYFMEEGVYASRFVISSVYCYKGCVIVPDSETSNIALAKTLLKDNHIFLFKRNSPFLKSLVAIKPTDLIFHRNSYSITHFAGSIFWALINFIFGKINCNFARIFANPRKHVLQPSGFPDFQQFLAAESVLS